MADNVNTDIAALQEIKKSLVDFREQLTPLKQRLLEYFDNQDYQIKREYERRAAEIEERHRKGSDEGRTDSFSCDTCGGRIMLKILGDTTKCRENGCNGTLHRVYLDNTYSSEQRQRDIQELKEMKETIERYSKSKDEFVNVLNNFFTSEMDGLDSAGVNLTKCISVLEEYLGLNISIQNSPSNTDGTELKKN